MELVPLVCGYMTPETQEALPHLVTSCQAALDTIATAASPKEMLMAVVEQLDTFQDTWQVRYQSLLAFTYDKLLRILTRR